MLVIHVIICGLVCIPDLLVLNFEAVDISQSSYNFVKKKGWGDLSISGDWINFFMFVWWLLMLVTIVLLFINFKKNIPNIIFLCTSIFNLIIVIILEVKNVSGRGGYWTEIYNKYNNYGVETYREEVLFHRSPSVGSVFILVVILFSILIILSLLPTIKRLFSSNKVIIVQDKAKRYSNNLYQDYIFCTRCGFKNDSTASFCQKCGNKIE